MSSFYSRGVKVGGIKQLAQGFTSVKGEVEDQSHICLNSNFIYFPSFYNYLFAQNIFLADCLVDARHLFRNKTDVKS